ncbi:MAG: hypothetical protein IAE93_02620 [Ignavibacteria bacterium]|nr:hypothetical protein [Ignavibacteria bacterium]
MNIRSQELTELVTGLNKLIGEISRLPLTRNTSQPLAARQGENYPEVNENIRGVTFDIAGNFEIMLGTTKSMLVNMGLMDSGFAKTVQIIVQLLGSITRGSSGGGIFSGLLGVIGGLIGGPLGAAAGTGIGSIFGNSMQSVNTQVNSAAHAAPQMINQVIIKNPVTFARAFDVEVRTRSLRGGIDL